MRYTSHKEVVSVGVKSDNTSSGTEISGGPVRNIISERNNSDGTKHTTESVVNDRLSIRGSWDTDKDGNMKNFHVKKN